MFPPPGLVPTVNQNSTLPLPVVQVKLVVAEIFALFAGFVSCAALHAGVGVGVGVGVGTGVGVGVGVGAVPATVNV